MRAVALLTTLAAAVLLTFARALSGDAGELSGLYDAYQYFGPLAFYMDAVLQSGELPLWNPLTYCGLPFAANPQAALFYPPHLLRAWLDVSPTPASAMTSMAAAMAVHMVLAGAGVFVLARSFQLGPGASLASAFAFMLSAAMVRRVSEFHYAYTLSWLPWITWLALRILDADSGRARARSTAAAGVLTGLAYLGGFLHIVAYMGVALLVFALGYRTLVARPATAHEATRKLRGDLLALAGVAALAASVSSANLLPALELAAFTVREQGQDVSLYVDLKRHTPAQLLQSLVVYPGLHPSGPGIRGSGALALALAVLAAFHPKRRAVLTFVLMWLVLVDCSFGPPWPVARLVTALTPFANSAHARAYDVALFPLSMLAGFGVEAVALHARAGQGRRALVRSTVPLAVGLAVLSPLWWWTRPHAFLDVGPLVVVVPAAGVALTVLAPWARRSGLLAAALALFVLLETLAWNQAYTDVLLRRHHRQPALPEAREAELALNNVRGTDALPNRALFRMDAAMNGYEPLNIRRVQAVLESWKREPDEYHRSVKAIEPTSQNQRGNLFLKRPFWLSRSWCRGPLPDRRVLFESAATVFLEAPEDALPIPARDRDDAVGHALSDLSLPVEVQPAGSFFAPITGDAAETGEAAGDPDEKRGPITRELRLELGALRSEGPAGSLHTVLRLAYSSTRAWTWVRPHFTDTATGRTSYGIATRVTAGEGTLEIPCPDMGGATVDLLLRTGRGKGAFAFTGVEAFADPADEDGLLSVVERGANSVVVDVGPTDGWRLLNFTDAHYPGWHATVDGEPTPIWLANDAFKAVAVPPGTHRVRFSFRPIRVRLGIGLSLAGLVAAGLLLLVLRPRSRHA